MSEAPHIHPRTAAAWHKWLAANHDREDGVWVRRYRPGTGKSNPPLHELMDEATCFGWIDSKLRAVDEELSELYFTPRRKGGNWAASNKERVERLLAEGRMQPAGMAVVERAKQDGSWESLEPVEALEEPADLKAALDADPLARANFDAFPPSARKQVYFWVVSAKRPETRTRRVALSVQYSGQNVRPNDWRPGRA